jgi:hypothetical protein
VVNTRHSMAGCWLGTSCRGTAGLKAQIASSRAQAPLQRAAAATANIEHSSVQAGGSHVMASVAPPLVLFLDGFETKLGLVRS